MFLKFIVRSSISLNSTYLTSFPILLNSSFNIKKQIFIVRFQIYFEQTLCSNKRLDTKGGFKNIGLSFLNPNSFDKNIKT